MASQSCRNIIAALSLCESCAVSISTGLEIRQTALLAQIAEELKTAAQEARKQWSAGLTQRDAAQIAASMKQADLVAPEFNGDMAKHTAYYTSLALGLLDELFTHIQDARKREHLERVEKALRKLCDCFDNELDRSDVYTHASQAVSVWLGCLGG